MTIGSEFILSVVFLCPFGEIWEVTLCIEIGAFLTLTKTVWNAKDKTEWSELEAGTKMGCVRGLLPWMRRAKINAIMKGITSWTCSTCQELSSRESCISPILFSFHF